MSRKPPHPSQTAIYKGNVLVPLIEVTDTEIVATVPCRFCGAALGQQCLRMNGNAPAYRSKFPHQPRTDDARRWIDAQRRAQ